MNLYWIDAEPYKYVAEGEDALDALNRWSKDSVWHDLNKVQNVTFLAPSEHLTLAKGRGK